MYVHRDRARADGAGVNLAGSPSEAFDLYYDNVRINVQ